MCEFDSSSFSFRLVEIWNQFLLCKNHQKSIDETEVNNKRLSILLEILCKICYCLFFKNFPLKRYIRWMKMFTSASLLKTANAQQRKFILVSKMKNVEKFCTNVISN